MRNILRRILAGATILALLACLCMLVLPQPGSRTGRRYSCLSLERNISMALQVYATNNQGLLPPAYIADESGRPMHSWRVLLLPHLNQQALYEQYRFDEPWNGPNNSKLAEFIPEIYQCPEEAAERDAPQTWTSFVAVVGPHTLWPGAEPRALDRIPDGSARTLLIVEVHNSGIHWMEPRDLHVGQMAMQVNPAAGQGISSSHVGGAHVIFADGHGTKLPDDTDSGILRQLIDIDDGEPDSQELP